MRDETKNGCEADDLLEPLSINRVIYSNGEAELEMKISQKSLWHSENGTGKHVGVENGRIIGERIRF